MRSILLILFIFISFNAFSSSKLVKILKVSDSKKSLIIDQGSNHKVIDDDYAVLLGQKNINSTKVLRPIAKLRSVKTYQQTSTWIVLNVYESQMIKSGNKFLLIKESDLLNGRTNLKIKRSEIVTKEKPSVEVIDFLKEDGQEIAVKSKDYYEERKLHDKTKFQSSHVNLVDVSIWNESEKDDHFKKISIYKSSYAKEFSDRKRIGTFEKMLVNYIERANDPNFNFDKFYQEQERTSNVPEVQASLVQDNYKTQSDARIKSEKISLDNVANKIAKQGDGWSDSYSDEELTELINNVGKIREKQRRVDVLGFKYKYQLYFSSGLSIVDNQLLNNSQNLQNNKTSFELSSEFYVLKNIEALKNFTFEFSGRSNRDGLRVGDFNAKFNEISGAAHINWYPFHNPYLLDQNIVYLGILFRGGVGSLLIDSENEQSTYQVSALPGFRVGLKYNFYNGIGVRLTGSYENITLDRVENQTGGNNLGGREKYVDVKLNFGVSKFF